MLIGPVGVICWASAASALPNQIARPEMIPIPVRFIDVSFTRRDPPGLATAAAPRRETSARPGPNFREIAGKPECDPESPLRAFSTGKPGPGFGRSPTGLRRGTGQISEGDF